MAGSYTADEQSAAKLAGLIADTPSKITAGITTITSTVTSVTTTAVTHGLGSTPDFCLAQVSKADAAAPAWSADGTTLTFTITSVTGVTVSYIAGYTV